MYSVYVLKSLKDGKTYVGCTKNLQIRINEHNSGRVYSTRYRIPLVFWHKEEFENKHDAFLREKHFKTAWGRRQLKKILKQIAI